MFGSLKKKSDIVVLKKTRPNECGGTDATLDKSAPKAIKSNEITLFDVTSALNCPERAPESEEDPLGYFSAFAAPCGNGTFLFLETSDGFRSRDKKNGTWAFAKENVFPALADIVRECDLAEKNGFHSETHGLPENFGGAVRILYASGEKISFSDNQSPIIKYETGKRLKEFFEKSLGGEKIALPDVSALKSIIFSEERKNGGYTRAELTVNKDCTGVNKKTSKYDGPTVYESEKKVDADTINDIKNNIEATGLLAWEGLPDSGYPFGEKKTLTFVFENEERVTVHSGRLVPDQLSRGFFNIELEITTKH